MIKQNAVLLRYYRVLRRFTLLLLWVLLCLIQFYRSIPAWFVSIIFKRRRHPPIDVTSTSEMHATPIVLIPGNMGDTASTAKALRKRGYNAIDCALGPVSSCHDRACEIFYGLKGGIVDYGAVQSRQKRCACVLGCAGVIACRRTSVLAYLFAGVPALCRARAQAQWSHKVFEYQWVRLDRISQVPTSLPLLSILL